MKKDEFKKESINSKPPWTYFILSVSLALITIFLFDIRTKIYRQIYLPVISINKSLYINEHLNIISCVDHPEISNDQLISMFKNDQLSSMFKNVKDNSGKIYRASRQLLSILAYFRFFGLGSVVFSIMTLSKEPRWIGNLTIPFAMIAGFVAFFGDCYPDGMMVE